MVFFSVMKNVFRYIFAKFSCLIWTQAISSSRSQILWHTGTSCLCNIGTHSEPHRRGVLKDVLGLEDTFKVLDLALECQVLGLKNCSVLSSRTALFFEPLKFRWKAPKTSRKICKYLFCFPQLEHRLSQAGLPPN